MGLPFFWIIFVIIAVFAVSIGLGIALCVYVYRDSKRYGMDSVLWTLVVFVTGFLGLIIYFLVRNERGVKVTECRICGKAIQESYNVCPHCGEPLKMRCHVCESILESGWEACPYCGEPVPDKERVPCESENSGDGCLKKILIAVIAIPVLLIIAALVIFNVFFGITDDIDVVVPDSETISAEPGMSLEYDIDSDITEIYKAKLEFYSDSNVTESSETVNADVYTFVTSISK